MATPLQRELVGTAGELHAIPMPTELEHPELWVMRPTGRSVVMGRSQKPELFDSGRLRADDVELAGRRSGGGAVYIDPEQTVWIDLVTPRSSELWSNELAENFLIVGRLWQQALQSLGVHSELVAESPPRTPASALACWAGFGWGEITVEGAKVVGLSQRRTRWGSRVQAMAVLDDSSAAVTSYFGADEQDVLHDSISTAHAPVIASLGLDRTAVQAAVLAAFEV